mgnify:CR=1 FL=1
MDLLEKKSDNDFELEHWWIKTRIHYLIKTIFSVEKNINKVIEVGAGTAPNLKILMRKFSFKRLVAFDINYPKDEVKGEIDFHSDLDSIEDKFDLVLLMDVLEHVDDDLHYLNLWKANLCKKGSYIFCTVPAFNSLWSSHDTKLAHYRRYTLKEVRKLFSDSGIEIKESGYIFNFLFPIMYLMRKVLKVESSSGGLSRQNPLLNFFLINFFKLEYILSKVIKIPFGTSVYLVARC